jgi:hypothetical protein
LCFASTHLVVDGDRAFARGELLKLEPRVADAR